MTKKNSTLYFLGDSHVGMFSGFDKIQPIWPKKHINRWSHFKTFRLGAHTAYNLANQSGDSYKLLLSALKTIRKGSVVVLSYGEIDCRVHLIKQSLVQGKDLKLVVDNCAVRYFSVVKKIQKLGYKVIIFEPIATSPVFINYQEFVTFGSMRERNLVTALFNLKLRSLSKAHGIPVVTVNHKLLNSDMTTNHEYYFDPIHVSSSAVGFCISQINKIVSKWGMELRRESDFKLKINLLNLVIKQHLVVYVKIKNLFQSFLLFKNNIFNIDNKREVSVTNKYKKYFDRYISASVL